MLIRVCANALFLASFFLALVGCASLPNEEISSYRKNFAEVNVAGNRLLDEISPYVSLVAKREGGGGSLKDCGLNEHGYPKCFDPRLALQSRSVEEHGSIIARRAALGAIQTYNDLLLDLAEGKPIDRAGQRVKDLTEFVGVLSSTLGIAGPLPALAVAIGGPALDQFLAAIRTSVSAAALRSALLQGAPIVHRMLEALADDSPRMYNVYSRGKELEFTRRAIEAARTTKTLLTRVSLAEEIRKFHQDLTNYVVVLKATSDALDVLETAAINPTLSIADLTNVVREAAKIRVASEKFWKGIGSATK